MLTFNSSVVFTLAIAATINAFTLTTPNHRSTTRTLPITPSTALHSYVADASDYDEGGESYEEINEEGADTGALGRRRGKTTPSVELDPTPLSKNGGNRFLAVIYDRLLDVRDEETGEKLTRDDMHWARVGENLNHIRWARGANLYNETFNYDSKCDVVWSYPILCSADTQFVGHLLCLDANSIEDARDLLCTEPTLRRWKIDGNDVPMYRWRHIKDSAFSQDDGRTGVPHVILNMDIEDTETALKIRGETNTSHYEYWITTQKVVQAGPLYSLTADKKDPNSIPLGEFTVVNAEDRDEVISLAENDPFAQRGLFGTMRVFGMNNLDVTGKFRTFEDGNIFDVDPIREEMEGLGYPTDDKQTPWLAR